MSAVLLSEEDSHISHTELNTNGKILWRTENIVTILAAKVCSLVHHLILDDFTYHILHSQFIFIAMPSLLAN